MAVTSQIFAHTPLTGPGLSIPTSNKMRQFAKWVEAKEVRNTPFTDWMKRRGEDYVQVDIETGQSYAPFITTTIATQTANNSNSVVFGSTAFLREGDVLRITDYFSGSTTELDYSTFEYATVLSITNATTAVLDRHNGEASSGSWRVHPVGSEVRVISRAQNYNEPFPDAITYRGDVVLQHPQRFDSGEITYDLAAIRVPDFESKNHMEKDILHWKNVLPKYREAAFIEGRKRTGDYLATPQIPYQLGGAIWWAEQLGTVVAVNGLINAFTFDDVLRDKAELHADGPGDVMWGGYKTIAALDTALNTLKGGWGPNETTFTSKVTELRYRWGTIEPRPCHGWPEGKILLTSKADWEWANFVGMDWQYVERGPEELGAFQQSWTMGGDFSMTCLNGSRQILLTGIETRLDLYPGRQIFLG